MPKSHTDIAEAPSCQGLQLLVIHCTFTGFPKALPQVTFLKLMCMLLKFVLWCKLRSDVSQMSL